MSNKCLFFLDQLQGGGEIAIDLELDPSFLELQETDEAKACSSIVVEGPACLVDGFICLSVEATGSFRMACALCNEPFEYKVKVPIRHQEPTDTMKQGKWNFTEVVREAILLELPFFPQCGGKECLHREEIQKYLVDPKEE